MEEVPVFVLAVAIAVAAMMIIAVLLYVESKPVIVTAPYFAVKPGPNGAVNVSIADFYTKPEGAYWYVDGQFAGYGRWVLAPCGANVTAVVLYAGATRSISGVIACTRPFSLLLSSSSSSLSVVTQVVEQVSQASGAMFQGTVDAQVIISYNPCQSFPPLSVTIYLYPAGGIWPPSNPPNAYFYQISFTIPCNVQYTLWGGYWTPYECIYSGTYSATAYYLMPWAQGGDEVPFNVTLSINAWAGLNNGLVDQYGVEGSYKLNVTNLITGQSYVSTFSGTLAKGTCTTTGGTKTVTGTYTLYSPVYPSCTYEVGIQGVFSGSNTQYGVAKLCLASNGQYYYQSLTGGELKFTANQPMLSITSLSNGAAQITLNINGRSTTITAQPWGPIGYNTVVQNYTYTYTWSFTVVNIIPTSNGYDYSLYPFQAPVLAFANHEPSAGPKYVS